MDFCDELSRLDLLIHREILRLRARYQLSLDEFRGVYVSHQQVDALVARTTSASPPETLTAEAAAAAERIGDASPLGRIATQLGLDRGERDCVLLALAPELELKYATLYAYLNDNAARACPTVELARRLTGVHLHASSRLVREGLLELGERERHSDLGRALTIAPPLSAALQELPIVDARLADWLTPAEASELPLPTRIAEALAGFAQPLAAVAQPPIVLLHAEAPRAAAHSLLRALGRGMLIIDGSALPDRPPLTTLTLLARLRGDGVFVDAVDFEAPRRVPARLLRALYAARVPVVVAAAARTEIVAREVPVVRLRLGEPDAAERRHVWASALAGATLSAPLRVLDEVAEHFRLGPPQIAAAVQALAARGGELDREGMFEAARDQSSNQLGSLAMRVPPRHQFSDLVLPPVVLRRVREVLGAISARAKVFGEWGFGHRGGSGLMVLFAGSSGTGKTMSAQVLAREIGLELYRIDLASVVSKYIGETEKNLDRIFEAARLANVILFFDEADALLGRRAEVKDAHDRYANIETAYLLQKMEEHDGVVILASNLSKNMDQAFTRRIHYIVEFPRPDAALREQLWRRTFPPQVPLAVDVDFGFLARQFDLAGGDIKTIALDAAFLAASEDRAVAMTDLVGAVSRQMLKQGRPLGASDFKQYDGIVARG